MLSVSEELWMFVGLAFTVAVLHSLNPDHWLPFVVLGRARNWRLRRTLAIASLAGTAHVGTSIIIGLIGVVLGAALAERFATMVEYITGSLLILFGLGFAYLSWRRGRHQHHGIPFITRRLGVNTKEIEPYMHIHHEHEPGHDGEHHHELEDGHSHNHVHSHEHEPQGKKADNTRAGYGLVAIIGLTPCVALLPIVFAGTTLGISTVITVMVVFFAGTLGTILLTTMLALKGLQMVKLEFFEKRGEVITGLVIALIGILVVGLGL
jgi:nickel/cobalt exporter